MGRSLREQRGEAGNPPPPPRGGELKAPPKPMPPPPRGGELKAPPKPIPPSLSLPPPPRGGELKAPPTPTPQPIPPSLSLPPPPPPRGGELKAPPTPTPQPPPKAASDRPSTAASNPTNAFTRASNQTALHPPTAAVPQTVPAWTRRKCRCASEPYSAQPATQSAVLQAIDKYGLSVIGSAIGCILLCMPLFHLLMKDGNIESTLSLWSIKGLEVGLATNLLWLLYAAVVLQRDKLFDTLVGNSWGAATNLCILLFMYSQRRLKLRATLVSTGTFLFLIATLVLLQVDPSPKLRRILEYVIGTYAFAVLYTSHVLQVIELVRTTQRRQLKPVFLTVAPNALFAVLQFITASTIHRGQFLIFVSSIINVWFYILEVALALNVHIFLKEKSVRSLTRMNAFKRVSSEHKNDVESSVPLDIKLVENKTYTARSNDVNNSTHEDELVLDFEEELDHIETMKLDDTDISTTRSNDVHLTDLSDGLMKMDTYPDASQGCSKYNETNRDEQGGCEDIDLNLMSLEIFLFSLEDDTVDDEKKVLSDEINGQRTNMEELGKEQPVEGANTMMMVDKEILTYARDVFRCQ